MILFTCGFIKVLPDVCMIKSIMLHGLEEMCNFFVCSTNKCLTVLIINFKEKIFLCCKSALPDESCYTYLFTRFIRIDLVWGDFSEKLP